MVVATVGGGNSNLVIQHCFGNYENDVKSSKLCAQQDILAMTGGMVKVSVIKDSQWHEDFSTFY